MAIQLQPASLAGTTHPIDKMITHVARIFGAEDDPEARANALDDLDRAAARLDMKGVYFFGRRMKEYSIAAADIADGDTTFDFPDDFAWPTDQCTAENASGDVVSFPTWMSWEAFKRLGNQSSRSGAPEVLSYANELGSTTSPESAIDGKIHVFPAFEVNDFDKLSIAYFARTPKPSEVFDAENIRMLPEAREAMLDMALALATQTRHLTKPNIWLPRIEAADKLILKAKAAAQRQQGIFHSFIRPLEIGRQTVRTGGRRTTAFIGI